MSADHKAERGRDATFDGRAFRNGMVAAAPLAAPGVPFGFVLGFLISESPQVDNLAGWSASWLVFAGSSQLAAVELLADGASALVIIFTVFLINSRHIMYSAALNPRFAGAPGWFRVLGSYLMIDQVFALDDLDRTPVSLRERIWRYLGAGTVTWCMWQTVTALGVLLGDVVPESWSLTFSVPLLFIGLMVLSIRGRPGVVAAVVGATVALLARDLPQGLDLLLAIGAGMLAGALADSSAEEADR